MNRKFKALGLAFVAVLAIAAVSAPSASATFTSEVAHTTITAEQPPEVNDVFTTNAGTVTCKTATYSGTSTEAAAASQTVTPVYSECTAFGFVNTKIDVNGCSYQFTTETAPNPQVLHILCPKEKQIEVTAFNCTVTVPAQTISNGITYDNEGSGKTMDIKVTVNATGITYIQHPTFGGGCKAEGTTGAGATSLFHDGKYVGQATVTATNTAGEHVSVTTS